MFDALVDERRAGIRHLFDHHRLPATFLEKIL